MPGNYPEESIQVKVYNSVKDYNNMYISKLITMCLCETQLGTK